MNNFDDNFFDKCMTCQHCYTKQDDDYVYCRKRNGKCKYKEKKSRQVDQMKLEIESDGINLKEYVCELTKELDELAGLDEFEYYELHHHYLLVGGWHTKEKYMAIRVPGGTVGLIEYDDDFKITKLKVDTDYVVKTYPKNVNEIIQKYIGVKVEFQADVEDVV